MQRVGEWAHCLSPCITGQWNANYPSYLSIRLIWNLKTNIGCPIISTSNHMFDMAIRDKFPSALLKILKLPEYNEDNFKVFKNHEGDLFQKLPEPNM